MRRLALSLLLVTLLGLLPGCGGESTSSAGGTPVVTPAVTQASDVSRPTNGSLDIISTLQLVGDSTVDNLGSVSPRSEVSARTLDVPPGYSPVDFTLQGQGGGTAHFEGYYADGKPSLIEITLTDYGFPDGETTASGKIKMTLNLQLQGSKRDGQVELQGALSFADAGEHTFDIFLAIVQDDPVGTRANLDNTGFVNLFPLRLFNNAEIDDSAVFVTIVGTDAPTPGTLNPPPTHYYYLAQAGDTAMTIFPADTKLSDGSYARAKEKSFPLTDMTKVAEHTYQVNLPTINLISGKVFFALGQPLLGIGANDAAGTQVTLPSPTSAVDSPTMFEQIELSVTKSGADKFYKLFVNATTIDTMCFGPALRVDKADGTHEVVGFSGPSQTEPDGSYCVRDDFIAEIGKAPTAFQNFVTQSGILLFGQKPGDVNSVVCVLGPPQVIGLKNPQGGPQNAELNTYLDSFMAANWATFVSQINPGFDYPQTQNKDFTYASNNPVANLVSLKCAFAAGTNSGLDDVYSLGTPTTSVVWECDDPDHKEEKSPYSFYANSGSQAHRRLGTVILGCFQRGVSFNDRADSSKFYTEPGQHYNFFSKVVHQLAYRHIMYGFGYDDVYGQDGTQSGPVGLTDSNELPDQSTPSIRLVTIIVPKFKPVATTRPTLTFDPASGPVGTIVTLHAPQNGLFTHATNVLFDTNGVGTGNFTIVDGQTITVAVPGFAKGSLSLSVAVPGVPGGVIDSGSQQFTVTATTFTFTPTSAKVGDTLTLSTGNLPLVPNPALLFKQANGEGLVGAPLTMTATGTWTTKVPAGVASGKLVVDLVGGTRAESTQPFTLLP